MVQRPVFIPTIKRGALYEEVPVDFTWFSGFAPSQKQKSIESMHGEARKLGLYPLLEVSTKSKSELGRRLSAFSLKLVTQGVKTTLESAYQSSKVFSVSGQHTEALNLDPYGAKKHIRLNAKGEVVAFRFEGRNYPTEPKNAFYDWLYIRSIQPHVDWIAKNVDFYGYTDIEFNPEKSINCQARSVATYMTLMNRGSSGECFEDFDLFRSMLLLAQRQQG